MTFGSAELPADLMHLLQDFDEASGVASCASSSSANKFFPPCAYQCAVSSSSDLTTSTAFVDNLLEFPSPSISRSISCASSDSIIELISDDNTLHSLPPDADDLHPTSLILSNHSNPNGLKPRFRRSRRRINLFPRIIKKDIRRDYANMFTNVLNSVDPVLMGKFMNTFCVNSVKMIDYARLPQNVNKFPVMTIDGVPNIMGRAYERICSTIPDFAFRLQSSHIKQHLFEPGSKVIFKARIQGSNLLKCFISMMENDSQALLTMASAYYAVLMKGNHLANTASTSDMLNNIEHWKSMVNAESLDSFLSSPLEADVLGTITFNLDDLHRIVSMEFEGEVEPVNMCGSRLKLIEGKIMAR